MEKESKHCKVDAPELDPVTQDKFVPHHEFDGIRELDNIPPWWLNILFVATVIFAYSYVARYHLFGDAPLQDQEYQQEMALLVEEEEVEESGADLVEMATVDYSVALNDEASVAKGKKVFDTNCVVCHLSKGEGLVGPNLTDDYWIHGGSFDDIMHVINEGVIEKGMVAWKNTLNKRQIHQVASYIVTLQGTNPPNAKAPEGEKYVPES
jgi:cytochrome c oxidase cbb3-type subunit 3